MLEISTKSPKKIALFLFVLCFVIRLAVIFTYSQEGSDTIDGFDYHNHALAILNGEYPTHGSLPFMRPPLYPLFLAGVYAIFPHDGYLTSWISNAVIDGLTCVVFYRLIIRLFDNHLTALISAVIFAFNLSNIFLAARTRVEPLFGLLTVLLVYLLVKEYQNNFQNIYKIFLAGIICGLAILCRANAVMFSGLVVVWFVLINLKKFPRQLILAACFSAGCALIVLPWTIRNYVQYKEVILVTDAGGYGFWLANTELKVEDLEAGNHQEYLEADRHVWEKTAEIEQQVAGKSLKEREDYYFNLGKNYVEQNPSTWLWLMGGKTLEFWSPFARFDMQGWKAALTFPTGLLMLFGLFSFVWVRIKGSFDRNIWLLVAFLIIGSAFSGILAWATIRYRIPTVDGYLIPFFIYLLIKRFGGRFEEKFKGFNIL